MIYKKAHFWIGIRRKARMQKIKIGDNNKLWAKIGDSEEGLKKGKNK